MTSRQVPTTEDTANAPEIDDLLRYAWQPALRTALDSHGAPARCKRRACRMAGECRTTVKEDAPLDCGGGLTDEAIRTACVAALFGSVMVQRFIADVVPPE